MKLLLSAIVLSLAAVQANAADLSRYTGDISALGVDAAALPQPAVPELRSYPGSEEAVALAAEAAADPDKFIDEHTPAEVALAFGFVPTRFMVTSQARVDSATTRITVDLSRQRLVLQSAGKTSEFKISSGLMPDHGTPGSGHCFAPDIMQEMHYSSLYNKAPMPHSIFFNGNIAIHATEAEWKLGQPASHGCVRLSAAAAKTVYETVLAAGKANTIICVKGVTPQN